MITNEIYDNLKVGDTVLMSYFSIFHNLELTEAIIEDIDYESVLINGSRMFKYNFINMEFYIKDNKEDTIKEIVKIKYEKLLNDDWPEDTNVFKDFWKDKFPELFIF